MQRQPARIMLAILILLGVFLLSKWLVFQMLLQPDDTARHRLPPAQTHAEPEAGQDTHEQQSAD
ncbi:MAG: hypothetical protein AOY29_02800 [Alcanivorax borkumensis]|jgi:hypothetical protein|uniref:hypothetical protein n=1 Tax=Alcanivorax TaxID=59753 RepID=UPI0004ABDF63|nr:MULTISPECIES: hypothetical protein [Alcanivorax]OJH07683.1 MAG: hypothetical protein AOY29_02800 [Alcanivorax borkumensis]BAP12995.1 oligopeptide ABC transporter permease protein [Alcanivorax sp. NBRC 101098]